VEVFADPDWKAVSLNQDLPPGTRLRTGLRSRATLRWSDRSVIRVDELTSMEIAPPEQEASKPVLNFRSGRSYFFNRERPGDVRFRTPVASGAIRGTEFNLTVLPDGRTELALLDGAVALQTEQGDLDVASGELAVAAPGVAPTSSPLVEAINVIQWVLYYPVVLAPADTGLSRDESDALSESMSAYRNGDLRAALDGYPANRQPASDGERVFHAALLLGNGQAEEARKAIEGIRPLPSGGLALQEMMAAVRQESFQGDPPSDGSRWLAHSYYEQAQLDLDAAREAARQATQAAPDWGPAWVRLAEMEFAFGRVDAAGAALDRGLELAPKYAPGHALRGFLLSAQNRIGEADQAFQTAIDLDDGLGDAWLGRGLVRIRGGRLEDGRSDLQVAATLEPQRSVLRSYLGKAWQESRDPELARKELELAKKLDPNDPTPWLYSALLHQEQNQINQAARDLQESKRKNDNRSLFRSEQLLDEDQAVRSANQASIYRDAGMFDVSVREAGRAVNYDYANASAHLFLANSYDALRDPKLINLRYETPWFSELMLAHLIAPVGSGNLSENVSKQEYARLFDRDRAGIYSGTDYTSNGDWIQRASIYGYTHGTNPDRFGYGLGTSFAVDAYYRTENGYRQNNDLEQQHYTARLKQELTEKDSVFLQASYFDTEFGDVAQYYNQTANAPGTAPSTTFRGEETQEPLLFAGYHREWSPGMHTLFLAGWFDDTFQSEDANAGTPQLVGGQLTPPRSTVARDFESDFDGWSAEGQQIWQTARQTLTAGLRYQQGENSTVSALSQANLVTPTFNSQEVDTDIYRFTAYLYEQVQVFDSLRLIGGVSYDRLHYPDNIETSPIISSESTDDQISPKAGFIWQPEETTFVRGAYTRSLGGVFFDTSVRLEPTQVAGFNQAFRSLIPESVVGLVPGTEFETYGAGIDHTFDTGTFVGLEGQWLGSEGERDIGFLTYLQPPLPAIPTGSGNMEETLEYDERSLLVTFNQLLGDSVSVGAVYRLTDADLERRYDLAPGSNSDEEAILHQVWLSARYYQPCGFFGQWDSIWSQQSNQNYSPDIPGDDFWQHNISIGQRFYRRRIEAAVGVLNIFDQDYRLNPLTLYQELPRERTFVARLRLFF